MIQAQLQPPGYRGRVLVLNFWASWCELCRAEAPALARLSRGYHASGVRFLGDDINDTRAAAEAFDRRYGIGYPSLKDPSARLELAFGRLLPPAIPDTLVLDRTGHVTARVIGKVTYPGLRNLLDHALGCVTGRPARGGTRARRAAWRTARLHGRPGHASPLGRLAGQIPAGPGRVTSRGLACPRRRGA